MTKDTKKYFYTFEEDGADPIGLLERFLQDEEREHIKHLIIGYWGECFDQNPQSILDGMIEHKDELANIESLYIGDMEFDECEVSWIIQGDYSKLFNALPNLKSLTIKGSMELVIGKGIEHKQLKKLEIICGGLDDTVISDIAEANFPELESLILYLGVSEYGAGSSIDELRKRITKEHFPSLKYLGLVDSEFQDEITEMLMDSDILPQLTGLELSYGTFSDKGGQILLDHVDKLNGLKNLKISYHFMTDAMIEKLKKLPINIQIDDQQDYDSKYIYPMLTE